MFTNFEIMLKERLNTIRFFSVSQSVRLPQKRKLKQFLMELFDDEQHQLQSINYIFCTDSYLLEINRKFLKHDYYTDVIAFNLSKPTQPIEAEVYISVERVKANATLLSEPFQRELHRVMFHAALHLCGYNDKTMSQRKSMKQMETYLLDRYINVSRGTFPKAPKQK
jgi:probable rRNA maturation factor